MTLPLARLIVTLADLPRIFSPAVVRAPSLYNSTEESLEDVTVIYFFKSSVVYASVPSFTFIIFLLKETLAGLTNFTFTVPASILSPLQSTAYTFTGTITSSSLVNCFVSTIQSRLAP